MDFCERRNTNNSKSNTDDASLPISNVDIPITKNPQNFQKINIDEIDNS